MDSTQYLVELKALDSAAYQVELDRLAAEQKAEQEAREEKLRTELADLKAKLVRAPNLTEAEQLKLYTRISELDSRNLIYAKERDRLKAIVQAQEEKARAEKRRLEELSRARSAPEAFLEIVDFNWSKEAFGSIMEATFIIKNNAPIDIKDITVLCEHSAASGTTGTVGPFTT